MKKKVLVFIVAYNAERHIEWVFDRIPDEVWENPDYESEILIIDDSSQDATYEKCKAYKQRKRLDNATIMANPVNQGYGGNQKIGYQYALQHGFDAVVLLHGDGQYPPEQLPDMIQPLLDRKADVVFGSRMYNRKAALAGGMPRYKFVGNIVLTAIQNTALGCKLTEFHTGYRAYSCAALQAIPFKYNSNDFDFDTDIIIQVLDMGFRIKEIPIPTHYGDETCHVNGFRYAWDILRSTMLSRLQKYSLAYAKRFDYSDKVHYESKTGFSSSHSFAVQHAPENAAVFDIGCGAGHVAKALAEKGCEVYGVDLTPDPEHKGCFKQYLSGDIDGLDLGMLQADRLDAIIMLDIIEHLADPEGFMSRLRERFGRHRPRLIITSANVAFLPMRLLLLLGQFNYGKRGILDLTHKRLFTFRSMASTLRQCGYTVREVQGVPAPYHLVFPRPLADALSTLNRWAIRLSKGLFSYQIAMVMEINPTLDDLLDEARKC